MGLTPFDSEALSLPLTVAIVNADEHRNVDTTPITYQYNTGFGRHQVTAMGHANVIVFDTYQQFIQFCTAFHVVRIEMPFDPSRPYIEVTLEPLPNVHWGDD